MGNTTSDLQDATNEVEQQIEHAPEVRALCKCIRTCASRDSASAPTVAAHLVCLCQTFKDLQATASASKQAATNSINVGISAAFKANIAFLLQAAPGVKLYQYIKGTTAGTWKLISNAAQPRFYDSNEDSNKKGSEFMLEVDAGDIDTRADDKMAYVADASQMRVTFAANGVLWALKFPDPVTYRAFIKELEVCPSLELIPSYNTAGEGQSVLGSWQGCC
jgi:hypothetical protein